MAAHLNRNSTWGVGARPGATPKASTCVNTHVACLSLRIELICQLESDLAMEPPEPLGHSKYPHYAP